MADNKLDKTAQQEVARNIMDRYINYNNEPSNQNNNVGEQCLICTPELEDAQEPKKTIEHKMLYTRVGKEGDPEYGLYEEENIPKRDKELKFMARHPWISYNIGAVSSGATNISSNAHRFASQGTNPNLSLEYTQGRNRNADTEGTEVNAARHTLWQATITNRYGENIAQKVGNAHEDNPRAHLSGHRTFSTMSQADQVADLLNNEIGRALGSRRPNAPMNVLAQDTLNYFHSDGLYVVRRNQYGDYQVTQTRISNGSYNYMTNVYSTLNENGQ